MEDLATRLKAVRETNLAIYEQIIAPTSSGQRPHPDPLGVLALKLNTLAEAVFENDSHARLKFELAFEHAMTGVLQECLDQRTKLTGGVLVPADTVARGGGLIIPQGRRP
jgi:hypothetical protein